MLSNQVPLDRLHQPSPSIRKTTVIMNHTYRYIGLLALMSFMVIFATGCAGNSSTAFSKDPTKLSGTWIGSSMTLNSRGRTESQKRFEIDVNQHGGITGTTGWMKISGAGGHDKGRETDNSREEIVGSLNKDDGVFFLVETEEPGFWYCRTINENLIHAHLIQTGTQHVSTFATLTRLEASE